MLSPRFRLLVATLCLPALLLGCGQSGNFAGPQHDSQLAWPPDEALNRTASDDVPFFRGKEYATSGGGKTQISGSGVVLGPHTKPSWAVYSLQGFGPGTDLDKVEIDHLVTLGSPDQNTKLYFGIANYATQTWEWLDVVGSPIATIDLPDFADYYSPSGSIHIALILTGNGYSRINSLRFYRTGAGANVPVPANVVATPIPGTVQLTWDAVPYVDGYNVYRNTVDDFATALKRTPTPISAADFNDTTVVKDTDYFFWVTAVRSAESAPSTPAPVHTIDTTVPMPQNLQGTPGVGSAHLTWDPVGNAIGYKVYRSRYVDFGSEVEFTCTGTTYDDTGINPKEQVYYYRVAAVGAIEVSPKTAGIDMFIPSVNLPAPTNFQVDDAQSDGDFVTFTWEYAFDPAQFDIYIHRVPDFPLDAALIAPNILRDGDQRSAIRFELPAEGGTYYARICARDATASMGFMTDAISFTNHAYFVFAPQEDIGTAASYPFAATVGGGELAVAYFSGSAVKLATKVAGTWGNNEIVGLASNFGTYIDIAYGGGKYCIGAFQPPAGDCWTSVGTHGGSWTAERIHGNGSNGPGHEVSGVSLSVAASDTEFAVTHITDTPQSVLVQTRANSGGAWDLTTAFALTAPNSDLSLAFTAADLMLCASDYDGGNLLLGGRSGGYSMSPVNLVPGDFICQYNALGIANGNLITPCVDMLDNHVYAYHFDGSAWQRDDIFTPTSTVSRIDMATLVDKVFVTYLCPPQSRWYCAYFDGTEWRSSSIVTLPTGTMLDEVHPLFLPTGEPYIIFRNELGQLYGAMGNLL